MCVCACVLFNCVYMIYLLETIMDHILQNLTISCAHWSLTGQDAISSRFVVDCMSRKTLLQLSDYRLAKPPGAGTAANVAPAAPKAAAKAAAAAAPGAAPARRGHQKRDRFTAEDDVRCCWFTDFEWFWHFCLGWSRMHILGCFSSAWMDMRKWWLGLQDDAAMVDWVKKNPYLRTQGKEIWQRAVTAKVTGHSWHFGCLLILSDIFLWKWHLLAAECHSRGQC